MQGPRAHVGKLCSEASDVLTRMGGCRGNSVVNLEEAISGSGEGMCQGLRPIGFL